MSVAAPEPSSATAKPAVVFALTLVLIGLTFAFPIPILPRSEMQVLPAEFSREVGNVYAIVAWAGWAHFIAAFYGQFGALRSRRDGLRTRRIAFGVVILAGIVAVLFALRSILGVAIFGALVWLFFIDHFIRAERVFDGITASLSRLKKFKSTFGPIVFVCVALDRSA